MFAMAGPAATAISGRMAFIRRFASDYVDEGELATLMTALETYPPRAGGSVVVAVDDERNELDRCVSAFLLEQGVSAYVERIVARPGKRARARRWLGQKWPLPQAVGSPPSAVFIDVSGDAGTLTALLGQHATHLIPGGLLFIDDFVANSPAGRVADEFLARHPDFEVLVCTYFLVARRFLPPEPMKLEQVNLCLNYNTCNLRCPACWTTHSTQTHAATGKPAFVPWDQLEGFLARPALEKLTVVVIGGGEPLLYPAIDRFLQTAPTAQRRLMLMSNATLLHRSPAFWEVAEHAQLTLSVSLDAARPETYAFVRQPAQWGVTRENIERFARLRDERNPRLELQTSFVVLRHNVDEIVEFMHLNKEWGSRYVHFHPALSAGFPEEWRLSPNDPHLLAQLAEAFAFGQEHGIALDQPEQLVGSTSLLLGVPGAQVVALLPEGGIDPRKSCKDYRRQVAVDVAGETYVCDTAFRVGYSLGNAYERPLDELWNGARWQSLRETHARGTQLQHPLCKHCVMGAC